MKWQDARRSGLYDGGKDVEVTDERERHVGWRIAPAAQRKAPGAIDENGVRADFA
jgi:hypothetical protein